MMLSNWPDVHGMFDFVDELPDKIKVDKESGRKI